MGVGVCFGSVNAHRKSIHKSVGRVSTAARAEPEALLTHSESALGYSERIRKDVGADTVQTHHARAKQTKPLADSRLLLQTHTGSAGTQAGGSAAVL